MRSRLPRAAHTAPAPHSRSRKLRPTLTALALACLLGAVALVSAAFAGGVAVTLDGAFDDWTSAAQDTSDPSGDDGVSGIDFTRLELAHDQDWLFLRFDTTVEVQPDEQQDIVLYLDTDMNAGTGYAIGGIGADLVWELGQRSGTFYTPSARAIDHQTLGLVISPTVGSVEFEMGLRRDAMPAGSPLFPGNSFRMILRDRASGGDYLPDAGSVNYSFDASDFPVSSIPLELQDSADLRVTSYNIQGDGLFDTNPTHQAALQRIFQAIDSPIWVIAEVWNHTATDVKNKVESFLPSGPGESWYATGGDGGNVIVSRFPLIQSWFVSPGDRILGCLLDTEAAWGSQILVVAHHWSCCTADDNRQRQADATIDFVRDAMTPGGSITLAEGTPIVHAGDFNLVGWAQQLVTMVTGDIQDTGSYGSPFPPDWDGSDQSFSLARHTDQRTAYTWSTDYSSFYPGLLDYLFYTDSVVELAHGYVLDTRTMLPSKLIEYGLQYNDSPDASDHCPRVSDLALITGVDAPPQLARGAKLLPNVPNPFNPRTTLRFSLGQTARVQLEIVDARGRAVRLLLDTPMGAGDHERIWDGRDDAGGAVASGVYRVMLRVDGHTMDSRPVVLVR